MTEEFRPYPLAPDSYLVSESGVIYSRPRTVGRAISGDMRVGGRVLKPHVDHRGHLYYNLRIDKEQHRVFAHVAVMSTFVGPRPEGMQICHWDDDPANNHVSNLRYGTASENMFDRVRNGKHHNSNRTHCRLGHEYNEQNTLNRPDKKSRDCLACRSEKIRLRSVYRAQIRHKKNMFKIADKLSGFISKAAKWGRDDS